MPSTTIRVSADRVVDGVATRSTFGEIVVSSGNDAGRVIIVADANWKCDQFSLTPADAIELAHAITQHAKIASEV